MRHSSHGYASTDHRKHHLTIKVSTSLVMLTYLNFFPTTNESDWVYRTSDKTASRSLWHIYPSSHADCLWASLLLLNELERDGTWTWDQPKLSITWDLLCRKHLQNPAILAALMTSAHFESRSDLFLTATEGSGWFEWHLVQPSSQPA